MSVLDDDEGRIYQATYGDAKDGEDEQPDDDQEGDGGTKPPPTPGVDYTPGENDDLLDLFQNVIRPK